MLYRKLIIVAVIILFTSLGLGFSLLLAYSIEYYKEKEEKIKAEKKEEI